MPCYRPLSGYRSRTVNPASGKRSIVFNIREGLIDMPVQLPCGQCIGCRLEKSRQWAIRAMHEAKMHDKNCFVTLTYRPEDLPEGGTLNVKHTQEFMKKVRKRYGAGIRSYGCGEYGENFGRPHYHVCLFGHDFGDKQLWRNSKDPLYVSKELEECWPHGFSTLGAVTFESAAYVARYVLKKLTGDNADEHYGDRLPEQPVCVSRRPGLGRPWLEKYASDTYPSDSVIVRGREMRPPKYYDRVYELYLDGDLSKLKFERKEKALESVMRLEADGPKSFRGRDRLYVLEEVKEHEMKLVKRNSV